MRNLKRALSVALAAVMLLGMMVVGAGAMSIDDFADKDEIVNQDAVALMVDLGVLEGLSGPNGTTIFQPEATLQRQALAKIAYMVATGSNDWDVYATANPKFKDLGNSWAKGAIEYCNVMGYITGYTDTVFGPEDTLTVAQTAIVLLRVLGFDSDVQGYNGDSYMICAMRDAKEYGLLEGVGNTSAASPISRQDACQMAYNALFINTRTANKGTLLGEPFFQGYTVHTTTLGEKSYDLYKISATVSGINNGVATLSNPSPTISGVTVKLPASPEMIGSNVVYFVKGTATRSSGVITSVAATKLYSTALAEGANNTVFTMTGPVNGRITTLAGLEAAGIVTLAKNLSGATDVDYYYNGGATSSDIGKKGVIVDLKDTNADGAVDTVVVTKKTVATLSGDVETKVVGKATQVKVPGVINAFSSAATTANVKGYEGLKKGDVVMYVVNGGVYYIEKVEPIVGQMTAKTNGGGIIFNGATYAASDLVAGTVLSSFTDYNKDTNVWLDDNGTVIAIALVPGETPTINYAVLLSTGWAGSATEIGGNSYPQAQLLYPDGTTAVVKLGKVDSNTVVASGASTGEVNYNNTTAIPHGVFYSYTPNTTGGYDLTKVVDAGAVTVIDGSSGAAITPGKAEIATVGGSTKVIGTNNTVFLLNNGDAGFATATGIANVPKFSETNATFQVLAVNGLASLVYISNGTDADAVTTEQTVYFLDADTYTEYPAVIGGDPAHRVYSAIVDGAVATVKVSPEAKADNGTDYDAVEVGLKKVTYTAGIITKIEAPTATDGTGTAAAVGGVVNLNTASDTYYTYTDETVVYTITGTKAEVGTVANIATDANDSTTVVVNALKNTQADVIYIVKNDVDTSLSALTATYGDSNTALTLAPTFAANKTSYTTSGTVANLKGTTVTLAGTATDTTNAEVDTTASTLTVDIPETVSAGTVYTLRVVVAVQDGVAETNPLTTTYTVTLTVTE